MSFDALLFSALFLLVTVSITVGVSKKLGLGSILGLLVAGVIVGPYSPGPAVTDQVETLRHFAEIGVVLLLFLIGLEMRPQKLWSMRKDVFGFGSLQILISGVVIGGYVLLVTPIATEVSLLIGLTLALSSTAFVVQILQERSEMASRYGGSAFAVLLMQDLAVVPLLAVVPILSDGGMLSESVPLWKQLLVVSGMIASVVLIGRYLVPLLLERFARDRNKEAFMFVVMLSVVFAAWAMEHAGLSMALGAFLMGMTLSGSRYNLQIEAQIEPYKGILMSLFFVAVGMSLDLGIVAEHPGVIAQHVFVIMLIKIVVLFFLALLFGHTRSNAFRISFLLSQSGEFGFVLFGAALTLGVIDSQLFAVGIAVISITLLLTPFYIKMGEMFARNARVEASALKGEIPEEEKFAVVIAGYGRVGQVVGDILEGSQIPYIAYDRDHELVSEKRARGKPVYYGEMSDPDFLQAIKLARAKLVVVTVDTPMHAVRIVSHIKSAYPSLKIFARAKDMKTKDILIKYGANWAMQEAAEGSLRMGAETLLAMDVDKDTVRDLLTALRKDDYAALEGRSAAVRNAG